ncbi:MAG: hypothetical protein EOM06_11605 [Sphingobacteriia bacterium]|nr:hypothetical protein [Sphingobacteriia bacterium]
MRFHPMGAQSRTRQPSSGLRYKAFSKQDSLDLGMINLLKKLFRSIGGNQEAQNNDVGNCNQIEVENNNENQQIIKNEKINFKTFQTKVAGVTHGQSQSHLERLAKIEESFEYPEILLVREPDNKHDKNAIKVILHEYNEKTDKEKELHIGYIAAHVASSLAGDIDNGHKVTASVDEILGGHDEDVPYGLLITVQINFDGMFGSEKNSEVQRTVVRGVADRPKIQHEKNIKNVADVRNKSEFSDVLVFEVENPVYRELNQCIIGDFVSFWHDSELENIRIYRRGTVGGLGRIGDVPYEYYSSIYDHLQQKLEFETEILDITTGRIRCRLVPKAETDANWSKMVQANSDRLSTEVTKKYKRKPKDGFEIRITLPKNHSLNEGDFLYLEKQSLTHYIQNSKPFNINLVNEKDEIVGIYGSFFDLCIRMLRAFYNGYTVKLKITSVRKPDIYEMKYIDTVYAMAIVIFEPETLTTQ